MFGEDELVRSHKHRADAILNVIFIAFAIILARLWYLQIYKGDLLYKYAQENRLRKEILKAPRGMIFSRNNQLMVDNVPRFDAIITPQYLANTKQTIAKLSEILELSESDIDNTLAKYRGQARYRPIVIKKNISRREVAIIETESAKMPGVSVQSFISREYIDKEIGGHVLGYISEITKDQLSKYQTRDKYDYKLGDFIGQAGIEEHFDLFLRGEDGHEFVEVDAFGRMKRHFDDDNLFKGIENIPASPGNNIRLTIDRDLQLTAFKGLDAKDRVGSVIAVDVKNGDILTMVSRPSFDPAQFSLGITSEYWNQLSNDGRNPLRNKAIQDHYPPGSTFKTVTAIAALEEGIIDEDYEVHCPGWFRLGRRKFHCWKKHGHGKVKVRKALQESCDVFFYKIATKLDIDVLAKYASMLGFGAKTKIALDRETSGLIPTKDWKEKRTGEPWVKGETLSCVIGQSYVLTTPLQLTMAYASMANGGRLFRPHLVKEVFSNSGKIIKQTDPDLVHELKLSPKTMALVTSGLYDVVNKRGGTAWWYRGSGIEMVGKSGTIQLFKMNSDKLFGKCIELPYDQRHHAIFVAYAPARAPKIAVGVVVEHGCSGSSAGAPIARDVITKYLQKYHPKLHAEIKAEERIVFLKELKKQKLSEEKKETLQ